MSQPRRNKTTTRPERQLSEKLGDLVTKTRHLLQKKQYETAEILLIEEVKQLGEQAELSYLQALLARSRGQHEKAISLLRQALQLDTNHTNSLHLLASLLHQAALYSEALNYIERAQANAPKDLNILEQKALTLSELHRYDEAADLFELLIAGRPNDPSFWNNAANLWRNLGQIDKAAEYYHKGMACAEADDMAYANYLTALHYHPHKSAEQIFAATQEWQPRYAAHISPDSNHANDRDPAKKLRVGMFSDGFRAHPVGQMITSMLEQLPRHELELYLYSTNNASDTLTRRIQKTASRWMSVTHLNEAEFAEQIRQDRIDVLIDLCGHNAGSRMRTMVRKPAPVQVKWVGGLINTTGVDTIDYLLSDSIETPPGVDHLYSEKLIRLPDDYICYNPPIYTPDITAPPASYTGYITLGCFNNPTKINEPLLDHWAGILHSLPTARLFLKGMQFGSDNLKGRVRHYLEQAGIAPHRILIEGPSPHNQLLQAYNRVDIALDPWPYSGGLTTCEALFMGVPVVTLPGPTFAGRHSASHLTHAGLGQLVAKNWQQYHDIVVNLASDLDNLANIRRHLRSALLSSPVCDAPRMARNFSNAMRAIWQRYCAGKAPAALTLSNEEGARFEDEATPLDLQCPQKPDDAGEHDGFHFSFSGKIVALDNGAILSSAHKFAHLHRLGALSTLCLDPGSLIRNAQQLQHSGEFQHVPMTTLGDGQQAQLCLTVDPAYSGTLAPLPAERLPEVVRSGCETLTTLPVQTLRLDDLDGMETLEWLVLDNQNDLGAILTNGANSLAHPLLVQIRVNFLPTHNGQIAFTDCQQRMSELGFDFHGLFNRHKVEACTTHDEQLLFADAVFIPDAERCATLNKNQCLKLGFLLHAVYQSYACAHQVLEKYDPYLAEDYRNSLSDVESKQLAKSTSTDIASTATAMLNTTQLLTAPKQDNMKSYENVFGFNFNEHIVALEHGARFASKPHFQDFLKKGGVNYICLDPGCRMKNVENLQETGLFQLFPLTVLGDGTKMELALSVNAERSTTLPIRKSKKLSILPNDAEPELVSTTEVTSNRIDDINGLKEVDWLILDTQHHNLCIIQHGQKKLSNALLIDVGINFSSTHSEQVDFGAISQTLYKLGFTLLKINEPQHKNYLPEPKTNKEDSALIYGIAIFIPNNKRLETFTDNQIKKLAFILDSAYNLKGVAFKLISKTSVHEGELYIKNIEKKNGTVSVSINKDQSKFSLPTAPAMTKDEQKLFLAYLKDTQNYFEFGSGGSTVWAVEQGLIVEGVESDPNWVCALQNKLGQQCKIKVIDIGPTGDWGYPLTAQNDKFPNYSQAILSHNKAFELILIDGRFRVACTMATIEHIIKNKSQKDSFIFIHDFWNRPQYHCVLNFLEVVEKVDSAGVFKVYENVSSDEAHKIWLEYCISPA